MVEENNIFKILLTEKKKEKMFKNISVWYIRLNKVFKNLVKQMYNIFVFLQERCPYDAGSGKCFFSSFFCFLLDSRTHRKNEI